MLKRLILASIGLILAGSLSAKETTVAGVVESMEGHSLPVALERPTPRAPVAAESQGQTRLPAWQEPGFVMDEVIATAKLEPLDVPEAEPVSPDLEDLLELHRAMRTLNF